VRKKIAQPSKSSYHHGRIKKGRHKMDALMVGAVKRVNECIAICEQKYEKKFLTPRVRFDLRGRAAGQACFSENYIRLNMVLFKDNIEDFFKRTIPHEVAHLVTRQLHPFRVSPHGQEWRDVMYDLGCDPSRTHCYDVSKSVTFTKRLYELHCTCKTHRVSATIIRRMRRGQTYTCRQCGQKLEHGPLV